MNRTGVRPSPIFLAVIAVAVLGGLLCAFSSIDLTTGGESAMGVAGTVLLVLGGWGVTLCLHEFGHAIVAYKGGDYSVRAKGYLNLDPRRYTDPVFSLLLPLLFLLIGGVPLPGGAVWINRHSLRSKQIDSMVSLAGPIANLVCGIIIAVVTMLVWPGYSGLLSPLCLALSYLALVQFVAFIINILPIPGLDGWGAIEPWLPYEARRLGATVRPWAPLVLFALFIGVPTVGNGLYTLAGYLLNASGGNPTLAGFGYGQFMFWRH